MRDIAAQFKELRLNGMAGAWVELTTAEGQSSDVGIQTSRWLIEHLLQAEHAQRAFASVRHQMKAAKFPLHRDLAGFDFEASKIDHKLVKQLSTLEFTETAQNVVLIGGPGTGKTHCSQGQAGALLFHGGSGQRTGEGEARGQGWAHRTGAVAPGPGDSG